MIVDSFLSFIAFIWWWKWIYVDRKCSEIEGYDKGPRVKGWTLDIAVALSFHGMDLPARH